ncbi:MAG: hypothetical protein ACI9DK_001455 [Vicingaceae bacterium]|jgi:hypothetical protein
MFFKAKIDLLSITGLGYIIDDKALLPRIKTGILSIRRNAN